MILRLLGTCCKRCLYVNSSCSCSVFMLLFSFFFLLGYYGVDMTEFRRRKTKTAKIIIVVRG